jgi:hypothetical protein
MVATFPLPSTPSPFTWANPTLGTTLNGERLTRAIQTAMAALRASFAGAGYRLGAETVPEAQLSAGSSTQAYRLALAEVTEVGGGREVMFKVGVQYIADVVPDEICPTFSMAATSQTADDSPLLEGDMYRNTPDIQAWADEFCGKLLDEVTP